MQRQGLPCTLRTVDGPLHRSESSTSANRRSASASLLGAWWADHSWGRWWNFDPKETWALATWIVYLIVIHVRLTTGHNRGLVTAWLSVVGFFVMLWTYFGVNLILPGLHAYA